MADFDVVVEKLHSFESSEELAAYFHDYGIKAVPQQINSCAISKFVEIETGEVGKIVTTTDHIYMHDDGLNSVLSSHTDTVRHFIHEFDSGKYPELIVDGFIFDCHMPYNCLCNMCHRKLA